jgi:hypothetical protein
VKGGREKEREGAGRERVWLLGFSRDKNVVFVVGGSTVVVQMLSTTKTNKTMVYDPKCFVWSIQCMYTNLLLRNSSSPQKQFLQVPILN